MDAEIPLLQITQSNTSVDRYAYRTRRLPGSKS